MTQAGWSIPVTDYFLGALGGCLGLGGKFFQEQSGITLTAFRAARGRLYRKGSVQMKMADVIKAVEKLGVDPTAAVAWEEIDDNRVRDRYASAVGISPPPLPLPEEGRPASEAGEPRVPAPEKSVSRSVAEPAPPNGTGDTDYASRVSSPETAQCESGYETRPNGPRAGRAIDPDGYHDPKQFSVTILGRFYHAALHFHRECLSRLRQTRKLEIKWLGMAMQFGEPFLPDLLDRLTESVAECKIRLLIAMVNPTWEALREFNSDWPAHARVNHESLIKWGKKFSGSRGTKRVSVTTHVYKFVPNWHGFVIDDSLFYISICSWKKQRLQGGENLYALIDPGKNAFEKRIAAAFSGWFDVAFNGSEFPSERHKGAGSL